MVVIWPILPRLGIGNGQNATRALGLRCLAPASRFLSALFVGAIASGAPALANDAETNERPENTPSTSRPQPTEHSGPKSVEGAGESAPDAQSVPDSEVPRLRDYLRLSEEPSQTLSFVFFDFLGFGTALLGAGELGLADRSLTLAGSRPETLRLIRTVGATSVLATLFAFSLRLLLGTFTSAYRDAYQDFLDSPNGCRQCDQSRILEAFRDRARLATSSRHWAGGVLLLFGAIGLILEGINGVDEFHFNHRLGWDTGVGAFAAVLVIAGGAHLILIYRSPHERAWELYEDGKPIAARRAARARSFTIAPSLAPTQNGLAAGVLARF
jgi:hypothetical protein